LTLYRRPAKLAARHQVAEFQCGQPSLDDYLHKLGLTSASAGFARTYVIADEHDRVVAYCSLAAGDIERASVGRSIGGHGAPVLIPVIVLGRLAVDQRHHGLGLGAAMLAHALTVAALAADHIGARAVLVHALDAAAEAFYLKYGFRQIKGLDRALILPMRDLIRELDEGS
jgi:GNAT superfamily N-acetyltransferase